MQPLRKDLLGKVAQDAAMPCCRPLHRTTFFSFYYSAAQNAFFQKQVSRPSGIPSLLKGESWPWHTVRSAATDCPVFLTKASARRLVRCERCAPSRGTSPIRGMPRFVYAFRADEGELGEGGQWARRGCAPFPRTSPWPAWLAGAGRLIGRNQVTRRGPDPRVAGLAAMGAALPTAQRPSPTAPLPRGAVIQDKSPVWQFDAR